ncbi:MAG TPA: sugar ABC transporter permease [Reyranella sp.]|nr:sugar ABC transporter permease [Reyranella sp.]
MSSVPSAHPLSLNPGEYPPGRRLQRSELAWALAFLAPYLVVFAAFVVYPVGHGLWIGRDPALYAELFADQRYLRTVVNTVLFVGLGVNLMMFAAVLLSGLFVRREWWVRALLAVYLTCWALPAVPAFVSFHWMLIGEQGLVNGLLRELFGVEGPIWFNDRWLALGCNIIAYVWKWMPFWTVVFVAGRMAIPQEIYEAAAVDGATGARRFLHVVFPILANLYLVCTLLATLWTVGDFNTTYLVSIGAPARSSEVLATLGFHYAFDAAQPALGIAATMSALPILVPVALVLMRRLQAGGVQL